MEAIREAHELADEPKEMSEIIKDCSDGSPDEVRTKNGSAEASHRSAEELRRQKSKEGDEPRDPISFDGAQRVADIEPKQSALAMEG